MKPLFIVNPRSGGGKTETAWPQMRSTIEQRMGAIEDVHTNLENAIEDGEYRGLSGAAGQVALTSPRSHAHKQSTRCTNAVPGAK